ncbi:Uncharacterised protein [Vibrio cholerae]|uniref:Uncharacterized protein n=1 Tax=Vibrio cholerae TaxID=666 RepID=A0A655YBE1_VIBCL|nr:Uncharacterised protein [Vibrio cholerae]
MIDQYCARFHRGNSASSCRGHAAYIIVITYASEHHIGVLDTFCYRFSILPAKLFRPRHRFRLSTIKNRDVKTGFL